MSYLRRKALSQNFLFNPTLIRRLVNASGITSGDLVLDIGAGTGIITNVLLSIPTNVIAVEIDKFLFSKLSEGYKSLKNLRLICGDFLDLQLPSLSYKVFANIPFSITGEVLKKLLFSKNPPESCSLVLQKEAAEKFVVKFKKNSMLSVLFYPWFDIGVSYEFKRTDFSPKPGVDICLLHIQKRSKPLVSPEDLWVYRDYVVFKFMKYRAATEWSKYKWLTTYQKDVHCRGAFSKWLSQQNKLEKIHRTRVDANWKSK